MDSQFYEFWGNFLINVAQGQKQLEEMSDWMKRGFVGVDDLEALFRRCYGLNAPDTGGAQDPDPQAWQAAVAEFQNAFAQFTAQWGGVTQAEHQQVLEKCADLEKQVLSQQATIRQLRDLLAQKGLGYNELLEHMQGSIKDQSDQFQALMESIRSAYVKKKEGLP
jgi:phage tail tape-measure protein